jgi:tetratricopeptide (TPR) repeat protein
LEEINRTINVVKENPDTEITSISLHGYASPEGSYSNNTRLAKGRSEALKKYVMDKYGLSADMFKVESTPEDWAGLRAYVEKSNIALKNQVLELIDSDMANLDAKENRIKALDGQMYQALLRDCYPGLRHTDYVIHYTVRPYNLEEAKALLKTRPQLLSLEEMYLVAQTYEEGSEEFNEVFDIAVRMYPQDPTANINAAAMELKRGNVEQAERYLERSGNTSATALNNHGVYQMLKGNLTEAETSFNKAKELGSAEAVANLEEVRKKREDNRAFGIE